MHWCVDQMAPEGKVFQARGRYATTWVLASEKRARRAIIRCHLCDRPAKRLDCFWPYHGENNRCTEHLACKSFIGARCRASKEEREQPHCQTCRERARVEHWEAFS